MYCFARYFPFKKLRVFIHWRTVLFVAFAFFFLVKKIGVLLPQSNQYPLLAKQFVSGLKLALSDVDCSFSVEGIGQGSDQKEVINTIQKLVNQEDVNVLTGLLGHKGITEALDFVNSIEETLIYADLGATRPIDLSNYSSVFCNSMDLYKSTTLLGKYLIDEGYKNILSSSCYYEVGYGFVEAMGESLYENGEAQFAGHYITPLNPRENEEEFMREVVNGTQPDAVFAFHSGIYAEEHASFLKKDPSVYKAPVFALPFSVDNKVLNTYPEIFDGFRTVVTWFEELDKPENIEFVENYTSQFGKNPSIFSVLGYENGLLIRNGLETGTFKLNQELIGPRGDLNMGGNSNRTNPKHLLCDVKWEANQYVMKPSKELNYEININPSDDKQQGGWDNAYLCS